MVLPGNLHKHSFQIKDTIQIAMLNMFDASILQQQSLFLSQIASHSRSSVEKSKLYELL